MNKKILLLVISTLCLLSWAIIIVSMYDTQETRELQVNCFDLRGSLINSVDCTKTEYSYFGLPYNSPLIVFIGIFSFVLFFGGLACISFSLAFKINDSLGEKNEYLQMD